MFDRRRGAGEVLVVVVWVEPGGKGLNGIEKQITPLFVLSDCCERRESAESIHVGVGEETVIPCASVPEAGGRRDGAVECDRLLQRE